MNYRHAYHAGGIADVFKHVVLIALLARLKQKDSAFLALDTHAGTGLYDTASPESTKTNEFQAGIARLHGVTFVNPLLAQYRTLIRNCNQEASLRFYPGSPLIIGQMLRAQDRGVACELHEEDFAALRRALKSYPRITAHHRNGYEAMGAFLPPAERRGLILIDPPFENPEELTATSAALRKAHDRFAQGIYALWYPVKERPALWRFHEDMIASGIGRQLTIEFLTNDEKDSRTLNGSGMLIINPPYQLETDLKPALDEVQILLAPFGRVIFKTLAE